VSGEPTEVPDATAEAAAALGVHHRGYVTVIVAAGLLGIPLSLVAFAFLAVVHELEHVVWDTLPSALGYADVPAWWPIVTIGVAGVLVGLTVLYLPGHGGHAPVEGFGAGVTPPGVLPGTVLAAAASLVGGAVVGPEAPLIAIGSGLAVLAVRRSRVGEDTRATTVLAAAGAAAAISAIFGSPLAAAVIFLETLGLGRRQTMLVVLPCLVSSGVGALLFTGMGRWTGLEIGALAIPDLEPVRLTAAEVAWAVPLGAVIGVVMWAVFALGRLTARLAAAHVLATTVVAGAVAGAAACVYALLTGHSPAEVALSGQATLPLLATDPAAWSTGALIALAAFKALAYAVCLGTFRGGPAFPAIMIGAALGVLASALAPGLDVLPGLAIGMAAGSATLALPVSSVVLVTLLLGDAAASQMPVVILAVVSALLVDERLAAWRAPAAGTAPAH
jgi:H+/Cl- antiporter ClcA